MKKEIRQNIWTKYWNDSSSSSCDEGVQSQGSDIHKFWYSCSQKIKAGHQVLDLCTGKGSVIRALINNQANSGKDCASYIGVDISKIEQDSINNDFGENSQDVRFIFDTSIDEMPIETRSIDLITSQFGLEYFLTRESLSEIFRVLKDDGEIELVTHHKSSVLVDVAQQEVQHIDFIITKGGFLETIQNLIPYYAMLKNPSNLTKLKSDRKALKAREEFNNQSEKALDIISQSIAPEILVTALDLSKLVLSTAKNKGSSSAKKMLQQFRSSLVESQLRSGDLINVALDESKINELEEDISAFNREIYCRETLYSDERIVAWGIKIR